MDILAIVPALLALTPILDIAATLWRDATLTNLPQASVSKKIQLISIART
jgi:hypothetical protein